MDEKEAEKKRSLRNEKLKADRTSETEEQRKESLRIRREKDRARRRTLRGHVQTIFGKINVIMTLSGGGVALDANFFVCVLLSFC